MAADLGEVRGLRLLALDGGGIRGVSELLMLHELMLKVRSEQGLDYTPKPCDIFDLIGGTSTGGLIAILLGRLRLSVEEAIDEYVSLAGAIFSKTKGFGHDGAYSATNFEKHIKAVVKRLGKPGGGADEDLKLVEDSDDVGTCKVFVCTRSSRALAKPRLFKSYRPFSVADYPDIKIWEAARATSAVPTFFKSLKLGPKNLQESFVDGGMGTNNPTKVLLEEADRIYGKTQPKRPISLVISLGCGEASIVEVKNSRFERILPINLVTAMKDMITNCRETADEMENKFWSQPNVYFRFNVERGLETVGLEEWKEMGSVKAKTIAYLDGKQHAVELAAKAFAGASGPRSSEYSEPHMESELSTEQMQKVKVLRDSLSYREIHAREEIIRSGAEGAREDAFGWIFGHNSSGASNRELYALSARFRDWLSSDGLLFWICGKAASGKSTLMERICRDPRLQQCLGHWAPSENIVMARAFFTNEGTQLQRSREGLLRSLLYQALRDPKMASEVLTAYLYKLRTSDDSQPKDIRWSWNELRAAFASLLQSTNPARRLCFFIDGLDEYNVLASDNAHPPEYYLSLDREQGRQIRAGYLDLAQILQQVPHPEHVKVCVSSRPLNEFEVSFFKFPNFRLELLTAGDIAAFVRGEVSKCDGPRHTGEYDSCVQDIVSKASGVFLWVRLVTRVLVDGIVNGMRPGVLKSKIHELPPELGGPYGLYMRMVQSLDSNLKEEAVKMFDLMFSATKAHDHLSAFDLSLALDFTPAEAISLQPSTLSVSQFKAQSLSIEARMRRCGGLLEVASFQEWLAKKRDSNWTIDQFPRIRFIHITAREFLSRPDVQTRLEKDRVWPSASSNVSVALSLMYLLQMKFCFVAPTTHPTFIVMSCLRHARQVENSLGLPQTEILEHFDATAASLARLSRTTVKVSSHTEMEKQPWLVSSHHVQRGDTGIVTWTSNFLCLAVSQVLTLYVKQALEHNKDRQSGPTPPLLMYAAMPISFSTNLGPKDSLIISTKLDDTRTMRLLLAKGANPNETYKYADFAIGADPTISDRVEQSVWQWALAWPMTQLVSAVSKDPRGLSWFRMCWQKYMLVLLEHGADPKASVIYEVPGPSESRSRQAASALFVSVAVSWALSDRESSLPQAIIDKGAALTPGELVRLQTINLCSGLTVDTAQRWLPGLRERGRFTLPFGLFGAT